MSITQLTFLQIHINHQLADFSSTSYIDADKASAFNGFLPEDRNSIALAVASNMEKSQKSRFISSASVVSFIGEKPYLLRNETSEKTAVLLLSGKEIIVTSILTANNEVSSILTAENYPHTVLKATRNSNVYT
tara:strand:+ start:173445 stop:173843 length:399 start_codon:yes stop_codon:yes gene_type:complete